MLGNLKNQIANVDAIIEALQIQINSDSITADSIDNLIDAMTKQKLQLIKQAVSERHRYSISTSLKGGKTYYRTRLEDKRYLTSLSEEEFYIKLADIYGIVIDDKPDTLEKIYPIWAEHFKSKIANDVNSYRTLDRYRNDWNKYLKDELIVKKKITTLKKCDFIDFFEANAGNGKKISTKKCFSNVKGLISHLLSYAEERLDLTVVSIYRLRTPNIHFDTDDKEGDVFSNEDRNKIALEAYNKFNVSDYYKAILLQSCSGARCSEIRALQWKDIDWENGTFYIGGYLKKYKDENGKVFERKTNYTKSHAENGKRTIPISSQILPLFKELYDNRQPQDSDIIFSSNGHQLDDDEINHRLKAICKRVGCEYLSNHKFRFWIITHMNEEGVDDEVARKIAGHDNLSTTKGYNRSKRTRSVIDRGSFDKIVDIIGLDATRTATNSSLTK